MAIALGCERCGAELPPEAAHGPVQCAYCGTTSVPAPRVIEKLVERIVVVPGAHGGSTQGGLPGTGSVLCPRCGNGFVEGRTVSHTVRGCETCGGVFLDTAAVEALEKTRDAGILHSIKRFTTFLMPFAMDRRQALSCPICQTPFLRRDLGETGHSIDTCQTHGTFFDRGEVTAFADFCEQRRAGEVSDEDLKNAGVPKGFGFWKK